MKWTVAVYFTAASQSCSRRPSYLDISMSILDLFQSLTPRNCPLSSIVLHETFNLLHGQGQTENHLPSPLSLYHNCDSTTIRLRHDYDEKLTFNVNFARACFQAIKQARAIRRSRIVVVSQSNRN